MNLLQTIRTIEQVAAKQPTISSIVRGDVFRLNAAPNAMYGAFAWLQGEHRTELYNDIMQFSFTFFYVDRLTFGKGNETEIQSTGIETLENILRELAELGIVAGDHTFRSFTERFTDDCAGVFCTVTLEVLKDGICPTDFDIFTGRGDYNEDYNSDYFTSDAGGDYNRDYNDDYLIGERKVLIIQ